MADGVPGRADVDADQAGLKVVAERLAHYAAVHNDPIPRPSPLLARLPNEGGAFGGSPRRSATPAI